VAIQRDAEIESALGRAFEITSTGTPVLVDVRIDYSKKTRLTKGVLQVNFGRMSRSEKVRYALRALRRRVSE
jgi:acetolactate synthase-1/2/3 large subunit